MTPEVGQIINGKYRLVRLLGDGGMGSVFQAQHEKLKVPVALKFLHAELNRKGNIVERFMQEARASAQIRSEHVVRVSDVDQTPDGSAFIVLEYLEGQTLQALYEDYHKTGQRLSYAEALGFAMQMVAGLEAAHEAGVVHRDLKPDNVMITKGQRGEKVLKLLDFGIAKVKASSDFEPGLTRPGVIMGTPEYMAPEQAYSADGVDSRADVFSLGVIVFEMLAGRRPIGGEDPRQLAQAYLAGQIAKLRDFVPHVDPELAAAVHKAMSPLAKDRFATARAFREAIEPFVAAAKPPSGRSQSERPPPVGGSEPVMPPVALSAAGGGTVDDLPPLSEPAGKAADAGARSVPKTWPPEDEGSGTRAMSPLQAGGTPGTAVGGDMTALMSGYGSADPPAATPAAPGPRLTGRRKKRGMSVGAMLGIAGAIGLVVAGFVVLATRNASSGDDDKPRHAQQPPPPAMVEPQPQPSSAPLQPQPQAPPPAQPQPPTPQPPAQPQQPQHPRPHPSGTPTAPTAPTAPGLPPGVPSIPGLPTAPNAPPTSPSSAPSAPPGIPGMPSIPMPSGLPSFPSPFPPPPG